MCMRHYELCLLKLFLLPIVTEMSTAFRQITCRNLICNFELLYCVFFFLFPMLFTVVLLIFGMLLLIQNIFKQDQQSVIVQTDIDKRGADYKKTKYD